MTKFWTRYTTEKREVWRLVPSTDYSHVPEGAWRAFNKFFNAWRMEGGSFPYDPLVVYQECCAYMIRTAERIHEGKIVLHTSTPIAYLVRGGCLMLKHMACRPIARLRAEYRALEERCPGVSVRTHVEEDIPTPTERYPEPWKVPARHIVDETLAQCAEETRRGYRAWLEADGNFIAAAAAMKLRYSVYYYRFHHTWAEDFRRHCNWR